MKKIVFKNLKYLTLAGITATLISVGIAQAQRNSLIVTDRNGQEVINYQESHALVIWAGNYQHWGKLNNVEDEAQNVKKALEKQGFKVTVIDNPNGNQLRDGIKKFIDDYGYIHNNRLVIFFSGHGHTRQKTKGYLVPIDAPDANIDERGFLKAALPMQQIMTWAELMEAKHALFVFDSCFSGTIFKQKSQLNITNAYIRDVMNKPVRQFLTAGDADEKVPAKSVFTPLFIRGLEGEADLYKDGYVTGNELGLFLRQNLSEYTKTQTPQFGTIRDPYLDQGDIVFRISNPTVVVSPPSSTNSISSSNPSQRTSSPLFVDPSQRTSSPPPPNTSQTTTSPPPLTTGVKPNTLISSATRVDYTPLQQLLAQGKWKDADIQTYELMVAAANREKQGWLDYESINTFSCEDLRTIDQLWVHYSNGKFGFSVQKKIYMDELGGTTEYNQSAEKFRDRVGWRKGGNRLNYSDLTFELLDTTPVAHLPTEIDWHAARQANTLPLRNTYDTGIIFSRAKTCNL